MLTVAQGSSPLSSECFISSPACFMISTVEHLFLCSINICTSLRTVCFSPLPFYLGLCRFFLIFMRTLCDVGIVHSAFFFLFFSRDHAFLVSLTDSLPPPRLTAVYFFVLVRFGSQLSCSLKGPSPPLNFSFWKTNNNSLPLPLRMNGNDTSFL